MLPLRNQTHASIIHVACQDLSIEVYKEFKILKGVCMSEQYIVLMCMLQNFYKLILLQSCKIVNWMVFVKVPDFFLQLVLHGFNRELVNILNISTTVFRNFDIFSTTSTYSSCTQNTHKLVSGPSPSKILFYSYSEPEMQKKIRKYESNYVDHTPACHSILGGNPSYQ